MELMHWVVLFFSILLAAWTFVALCFFFYGAYLELVHNEHLFYIRGSYRAPLGALLNLFLCFMAVLSLVIGLCYSLIDKMENGEMEKEEEA